MPVEVVCNAARNQDFIRDDHQAYLLSPRKSQHRVDTRQVNGQTVESLTHVVATRSNNDRLNVAAAAHDPREGMLSAARPGNHDAHWIAS